MWFGFVVKRRTVESALQSAANQVRDYLLREPLDPVTFRASLNDIAPAEREAWCNLLWDLDEIPDDDAELPRGGVPYLPCPVEIVLKAIQRAGVTSEDVFVDVGSGAGRTTLLANVLTGAACIGVEVQRALVELARARAARLNLERTQFMQGDAAELIRFSSSGTVFFLYCPFDWRRVERLLNELELIARVRQIRICCVQMPVIERRWLVPVPSGSADFDLYRSSLPTSGS